MSAKIRWLVLLLALLSAPPALYAADRGPYPSAPIRWVIPFPPGGGSDIVARVITRRVTEIVGQQIIADNRGGASGNIAAEFVSRAAPDGYTLLMPHGGILTINAAVYDKLPYDPASFVPITILVTVPNMLAVHPSVPVRTAKEYIALAKRIPGKLTFGSSGFATSGHLANELLNAEAGISTLHVPYKGAAPALVGLVSGEVDSLTTNVPVLLPMVQQGKVRAIAIAGPYRAAAAPDVPTIAEAGLPGFDADSWYGVVAPAGTPQAIVTRLNGAIVEALRDTAVRAQLEKVGARPVGSTPEAFKERVRNDTVKWARIVKRLHRS
jgi:tripartite-type tricarboxylate transporter receptor subunit TctC